MTYLKYILAAILLLLIIIQVRERFGERSNDVAATDQAAGSCKPGPTLYRPTFATDVVNGAPTDRLVRFGPEREQLVFYAEVIGAAGREIQLQWFAGDAPIASYPADVQTDRWPTWSRQDVNGLSGAGIRVEVRAGDCLIGQAEIASGGEQAAQPEPRATGGWMSPRQAIEVLLAKPGIDLAATANRAPYVDDLTDNGDTLLLAAIRAGDTDQALMLIRRNTDVEAPAGLDSREADAWYGRRYRKADPFLRGADGVSPIQLAHDMGNDPVVEALLESAVTPYRLISRKAKYGTFADGTLDALLVDKNGFARFDDGDTPLHRAARSSNERAVLTMLRLPGWNEPSPYNPPVDIYAFDASGKQALTIAREQGNHAIERFLALAMTRKEPGWAVTRATFTTGMNGNEPSNCRQSAFEDENRIYFFSELTDMDGKTIVHEWRRDRQPVHRESLAVTGRRWSGYSSRELAPTDTGTWEVAILSGDGEQLAHERLHYQALTDYNRKNRAKMNAPCNLGGDAFIALAGAQAPAAELEHLLDKGMQLQPENRVGELVFKQAVNDGNIRLLGWLFDRGFDVNAYADGAYTPLMMAARAGNEVTALYLITRGADVQLGNYRDGLSALHVAAIGQNAEMTRLLLQHGADPNIQTDAGYTPLHRAVANCDQPTALALLEHGADPTLGNSRGERPGASVMRCDASERWDPDHPALAVLYPGQLSGL